MSEEEKTQLAEKPEATEEAKPQAAEPQKTITPEEYEALQQRLQETEQYATTYAQLYQQALASGKTPTQAEHSATHEATKQAVEEDYFLTANTAEPVVERAVQKVINQLKQEQHNQQYVQNFENQGEQYIKTNYQLHQDNPDVWLHIKELAKAYKANGLPDKAAYDRAVLGYGQKKGIGTPVPQNTAKGVPETSSQFQVQPNDANTIELQTKEVDRLKNLTLHSGKQHHEIEYYKAVDKLRDMKLRSQSQ